MGFFCRGPDFDTLRAARPQKIGQIRTTRIRAIPVPFDVSQFGLTGFQPATPWTNPHVLDSLKKKAKTAAFPLFIWESVGSLF